MTLTLTSKARSALWRDRRRLDAIPVTVEVLPAHRRALEALGLIMPGCDRHPQAIAWAVARYLDTVPPMQKIGEALYHGWPEEAADDTPLPGSHGQNEG